MITVNKTHAAPSFGKLAGITDSHGNLIELTPAGEIIRNEIIATPSHHPEIRILCYAVMPDHFHALLFVTKPIERSLGAIVQAIKSAATRKIRALYSLPSVDIFEQGFHDRIISNRGQLATVVDYIRDNPRRLAIRRAHPEFFRRVNNLQIGDSTYQAYGNFQLLDCPFKEQVIIHRADTPEQYERNRQRWLYTAANRGVLVSPFISAAEKSIRTEAEALGSRFILITNEPMGERYKPTAPDFSLCQSGRLLLVSSPSSPSLSRAQCLALNALASSIAHSY